LPPAGVGPPPGLISLPAVPGLDDACETTPAADPVS
jgi:hypothetical protein